MDNFNLLPLYLFKSDAAQLPSAGGTGDGTEGGRRRDDIVGPGIGGRHRAHQLDRHDHRAAQGETETESKVSFLVPCNRVTLLLPCSFARSLTRFCLHISVDRDEYE